MATVPVTLLVLTAAGYTLYVWWRFLLQKRYILHFPSPEMDAVVAPKVSIIIAARNEEASIGETLRSIAALSYPRFEVIVVNDRSTDGTGAAIDAYIRETGPSAESPPVLPLHLEELPEGWLGKNHALYRGYQRSSGELLLFTDADIRFHPDALASAVTAMLRTEADHVTAAPRMLTPSFVLGAFVRFFLYSLSLFTEPWFANDDRRRDRSMGVGAFNLITRSAYESIGTHRALAYRPDDDLRLGRLVKGSGRRQRFLSGESTLQVEWYPDLGQAIRGLEKNLFSGFQYRYSMAAAAALGQLAVFVLPLPAACAFLLSGSYPAAAWTLLAAYLLQCALFLANVSGLSGTDRRLMVLEALAHPLAACILVYVIVRSSILAGLRGGVYWRGTFYSLEELRRNR